MKLRCLFAALAAVSLTGCFKEKTLVVVNPDGSGNIVVSSTMSPEAAQMIGSMADGFAGAVAGGDAAAAKPKADPFFNEDELKAKAAKLGEGVTYAKGRAQDDGGWKGSVAVYSFTDINKLRIPLNAEKKQGPGGAGDADADAAKPKKFVTFALTGGDTKTLQIKVPQDEKPAAETPKTDEAKKDPQEDAMAKAMMAPMMKMMKGLEFGIAVQVKGEVLKSNALNREADGRIVIMHMDMDKMQTSPKFAALMDSSGGGEDMPVGEMLGMPGFQFETNQVVEVQFK